MKRLAIALAAGAILMCGALPGRADQTFWTMKTGATPKPSATAIPGLVNVDYIYYSCLTASGRFGRCREPRYGHRHSAYPPYPYIAPGSWAPAAKPPIAPHPMHS